MADPGIEADGADTAQVGHVGEGRLFQQFLEGAFCRSKGAVLLVSDLSVDSGDNGCLRVCGQGILDQHGEPYRKGLAVVVGALLKSGADGLR